RFHMAAKKAKLKAHIGAEVTCNVSNPHIACNVSVGNATRIATRHKTLQATSLQNASDEFRLPVLISSRAGYQNLCRMITKVKLRSKKNEGAVYEEELSQHAKGLICLTGGDDGPLAHALRSGGIEAARRSVELLIHIFGSKNVYIELQRHFHHEKEMRNRAAIEIARSLRLPLLSTNGVRYVNQ